MQLLKTCDKGNIMNCRESFYMQMLQEQNFLFDEQKANKPNPFCALGKVTKQHITQSNNHSDSVHARPAH